MSDPVKPRDVVIYEQVFDALLEQKLAPGTRLSEDKLGQVFGVSRTIIRKVLQRLEHEGVVTIHRNRGASVAHTSAAQVRQVFAARAVIELAVVDSACTNITAPQLAGLQAVIDAEQQARHDHDYGKALRLSGEWHLLLAEACGNEFLAGFARSLVSRCSLIIAQYEITDSRLCPQDEHSRILAALVQGDATLARQLMQEHINHIEAKIRVDAVEERQDLARIFNQGTT
ncbi:MAG: GntR family transcriptional regulator [Thiolinea sp.]